MIIKTSLFLWIKKAHTLFSLSCVLAAFAGAFSCHAERVEISSLEALAKYAALDGSTVVLKPGTYEMSDYLTEARIREKLDSEDRSYINFSGRGNTFECEGVTIRVDTRLRKKLRHPRDTREFVISGAGNTLKGLTIECYNQGTSGGGSLVWIKGDRVALTDCTFTVTGSTPYGYGDLFGKGGRSTINHAKHSGVRMTGWDSRVTGCTIYMRSFGHGFFIQGGGRQQFEDCLVEGEMRSSDDILAETEGRAFDIDFKTVIRMRDGQNRVLPGYMKSLAEDGYRHLHRGRRSGLPQMVSRRTCDQDSSYELAKRSG